MPSDYYTDPAASRCMDYGDIDMAKSKPKYDRKTRKFMERWGRREVPTAQVAGDAIKPGDYQAFALLGWVEAKDGAAIVGLQMAVLKMEPLTIMGHVTLGMPVTPKTELHVNALLQSLGWDGRIWPYQDHGWPEGTGEDEIQLVSLIMQAKLGCSLTFVPQEEGPTMIPLYVAKSRDPFPLAPFELEVTEEPKHLEVLRDLIDDPSPFKVKDSDDSDE